MQRHHRLKLWFKELWLDAGFNRDETRRLRLPFQVLKFLFWIAVICILYPIFLLLDVAEKVIYK
ncbi:MAG: hypothetical protein LUE17_05935 [Planctomycetaceae bacterium]|nr:hypothetical protein [Planctomycetaceae bacterium]